ncbi:hypothetical protein ACFP2T_45755 [Plantactinospora solaniradicis]|uniref:ESX-1 secretion-associated protein n=1 Tax=Plantactinospora solaniradicis TaxID=1723736 RepID=A0ABW1KPT7_9ACTN
MQVSAPGPSAGGEEKTAAHLAAIRADANKWYSLSDQMTTTAQLVRSIELDGGLLSFFGELTGLVNGYNAATEKMARLLDEGAADFDSVGLKLVKAARNYEDTDARAAARHKFKW